MTPTGGDTGARNTALSNRFTLWAQRQGGCAGVRSLLRLPPPRWLVAQPRGQRLEAGALASLDARASPRGFPPLCPELVVELVSPSDEGPGGLTALRRKLETDRANGAQLGWLLIPEQRGVEIWQAVPTGQAPEAPQRLVQATRLEGGARLPGLVLELQELWEG